MAPIRVVVHGALGRMGQEVLKALCRESDMRPAGAADMGAGAASIALPDGSGAIPLSSGLEAALDDADVVVDFTNADGAMAAMRAAAARGVNVVIGSTGIPEAGVQEADALAREHNVGIMIAPNFALGPCAEPERRPRNDGCANERCACWKEG